MLKDVIKDGRLLRFRLFLRAVRNAILPIIPQLLKLVVPRERKGHEVVNGVAPRHVLIRTEWFVEQELLLPTG